MQRIQYIDGPAGRIDATDRGLAYGDGLFETMLTENGRIRWLPHHLDRLFAGCDRLEIPAPDRAELTSEIERRLPEHGRHVLKLILTRGPGERGYAPPSEPRITALFLLTPRPCETAPGPEPGIRAVTLRLRLTADAKLAGIKHLCRLEQVLAGLELRGRDADDGLLLSTRGLVVGATSANLFGVYGTRLVTPRIEEAGICGVMRRVVLERCGEIGFKAQEVDLELSELYAADEIFMTNAIIGVQPIASLDDRSFPSRDASRRLREHLGLKTDA